MLTDAISSESYKLLKNRWTAFWSFGFPPFFAIILGLGAFAFTAYKVPLAMRSQPTDVAGFLLDGAKNAASPLTILFALIGAAVIFAGDYRWETWRLIAPRNSRQNHVLGKLAVFAAAIFVTVLLLVLANALLSLISVPVNQSSLTWELGARDGYWPAMLSLVVIAWLQLLQAGAVVALFAVLTRSIMGALIAPLVIGGAQLFLQGVVMSQGQAPGFHYLLLLPGMSSDIMREHALAPVLGGASMVDATLATKALLSVAIWIVVGYLGALVLFLRQDLSKE